MRLRFLFEFAWKPGPNVTVVYRAGDTYRVTRACARAALAAGAAEPVTPKRS